MILYILCQHLLMGNAMGKDAVFTMKLESDLRDQFLAAAEAMDRPASQIVREFMREFIQRQRETREHDAVPR
jgi:predicted transcriptional regulator